MADIESAEAYAARLCGHIVDSLLGSSRPVASKTEALRIITARDNAVANAVLDELEGYCGQDLPVALDELRAKYAPKAGG